MRFYAMPYREVMELPVRAFWFLLTQINRLAAEEGVQNLQVTASAQHPEAAQALQEALMKTLGTPVKLDVAQVALAEKRDEEGFAFLKQISS